MVSKYETFLPKLIYPIRTGEHPTTAFGLSMAYNFAVATGNDALTELIRTRTLHWYLNDKQCPLAWEPARVSDRTDGKLVHLDGLNFSRAWLLYGVAKAFPAEYGHL